MPPCAMQPLIQVLHQQTLLCQAGRGTHQRGTPRQPAQALAMLAESTAQCTHQALFEFVQSLSLGVEARRWTDECRAAHQPAQALAMRLDAPTHPAPPPRAELPT